MAKPVRKKVSRIKTKKKAWFKVIAPKLFGQREVGESHLAQAEKAIGRKLKINLKDLTGNVRDQKAEVKFQISKVDGSLLNTSTIGYQLTPAYLKRAVRKNTSLVDDHSVFKTKEKKEVVIKSLIISLHRTQRSTKTELRKQFKESLKEELSKATFEEFVGDLVSNRIQSNLKKKLKKVFPLKEIMIRSLILKGKATVQKEEVPVKKEEKKETVIKESKKEKEEPKEK